MGAGGSLCSQTSGRKSREGRRATSLGRKEEAESKIMGPGRGGREKKMTKEAQVRRE